MRCVNTGAPFHRDDGSVIETGVEFEATDDEATRFAYKLKPVEEPVPLWAGAAEDGAGSDTWTLHMKPELYLRIYPQGPHAALARRIVARGEAHAESHDGDSNT